MQAGMTSPPAASSGGLLRRMCRDSLNAQCQRPSHAGALRLHMDVAYRHSEDCINPQTARFVATSVSQQVHPGCDSLARQLSVINLLAVSHA